MNERCYRCGHPILEVEGGKHLACDRAEWSENRTSGWFLAVFLLPFALVGFLAGFVFSALRAGFGEGSGSWKQAWGFIQKPKP